MNRANFGQLFQPSKLKATILASFFLICIELNAAEFQSNKMNDTGIINLQMSAEGVFTSGQPTAQQLKAVADAGVKHVVNLRLASEQDFDEQAMVSSLGMQYYTIPVSGVAGITFDNAGEFNRLLDTLAGEPILLHCASGNRVGALKALAEFDTHGKSVEQAIKTGKLWGLTTLEPAVREKLAP